MNLINDVVVRCNECKSVLTIHKDNFDIYTSSYERNMGPETVYDFNTEVECDYCDNEMMVRVTGCEYPIGAFNYEDFEIKGGEFVINPSLEVTYYYDFEEMISEIPYSVVESNLEMIRHNKDFIYNLSPREFEEVVEELFRQNGFHTKLTKQTRDGGRDIIATKKELGKPFVIIIECKRHNKKNKVGVSIVRGIYGVQTSERVNKSMVVTSSYFTQDAINFASNQNVLIDLIDIDDFIELINL